MFLVEYRGGLVSCSLALWTSNRGIQKVLDVGPALYQDQDLLCASLLLCSTKTVLHKSYVMIAGIKGNNNSRIWSKRHAHHI